MRHTTRRPFLSPSRIAMAAAIALSASPALAAPLYWGSGGTTNSWTNAAFWFLDLDETLPGAVPTIADDVIFNTTPDNALGGTVSVTANIAANSLTFNTSGATLLSQSNNRTLTLGGGGITVNSGAGNASIGVSTNSLSLQVAASQAWTNHATSILNVRSLRASDTATGPVEVTLNAANSGSINFNLGIQDSPDTTKALSILIDSEGTGTVSLVGSSYTGGTIIKRGVAATNGTLGAGAISLGVAAGTDDVRLNITGGVNNDIVVQAGAGFRALTGSGAGDYRGAITLNRDLSIGSVSTSTQTLLVSGIMSGVGNVTIGRVATGTSNPTVTLSGASTYTGRTSIPSATVLVTSLGNLGESSSLGAPVTVENGTITMSAVSTSTLRHTGTGSTTDRVLELANNSTLEQAGTGLLKFTGDLGFSGVGTRALTLRGTVAEANGTWEFAGVISNNGGSSVSVVKMDAGTWRLSNVANTYTSTTSINGGVLEVVKLADTGVASSIGTGSSNLISIAGGTLRYVGTGDSTNRAILINALGATFDASGSGAVNFTRTTAPTHPTSNQAVSLTFTGANTDQNTYAANQGNNGSGAVSVTKEGAGTWLLSGNNTYAGATTVNNGLLLLNGSLSGSSAVTVNLGGTLGGTGFIGGPTSINSGGSLLGGDGATAGEDLSLAGDVNFSDGSFIKLTLDESGAHSALTRLAGAWTFDLDQAFTFFGSGAAMTYADIITGLEADPGTATWTMTNPGYVGTFVYDNGTVDLTLTAVPEPSAILSLLGGAGLLLGFRRRRA